MSAELDTLIGLALAYNRDLVAPTLKRRKPVGVEVAALDRLDAELAALGGRRKRGRHPEHRLCDRQRRRFREPARLFKALYETLLGSSQGPRMGSFIALYGIANTRKLIAEALA